jgi:hypothetical protein
MMQRMQRTAIAALGLLLAGCASQPALTDYTVNSGAQRSPDQQALVFDQADLSLRIGSRAPSKVKAATCSGPASTTRWASRPSSTNTSRCRRRWSQRATACRSG